MNEKNEEKEKNDWFKKLYEPLKTLNFQYAKLLYKKKEISRNQKLLNEYKIDNPQNFKNKIKVKNNESLFDEKILLKRVNINNYKDLDKDNMILKKILSKMAETNIKKNTRNLHSKLKRFKTNNDYSRLCPSKIISNNQSSRQSNSNKLKLNLQKKYLNYSLLNYLPFTERNNKNEKSLYKIMNKKYNLNIENNKNSEKYYLSSYKKNIKTDVFSKKLNNEGKKEEENNNNVFQTLTKVEKHQINNSNRNRPRRIESLVDMMKAITDGEKNINFLNKDLFKLKKIKKFNNTMIQNKKINKSINYSKIKTKKDIEEQILKTPQIPIYEYLKKKIKLNLQKKSEDINNDENNKNIVENIDNVDNKNDLVLPSLSN